MTFLSYITLQTQWTLNLGKHNVNTELDYEQQKERCTTPAVDLGDPVIVCLLFVHRLLGLMLITAVFPLGSWVNKEFNVGGPLATPHIPSESPLGEAQTSWTKLEVRLLNDKQVQVTLESFFEKQPSGVFTKHFACRTLEKIGWFGHVTHMAPWGCFSLSVCDNGCSRSH